MLAGCLGFVGRALRLFYLRVYRRAREDSARYELRCFRLGTCPDPRETFREWDTVTRSPGSFRDGPDHHG